MKQTRNSKHSRKSKLSFGIKIAGMLTCIALVSVGFASWLVVNQPGSVDVEGSNITASSATEIGLSFNTQKWVTGLDNTSTEILSDTAPEIVFGKGTCTNANPWLVWNATDKADALEAVYMIGYTTTTGITSANIAISVSTQSDESDAKLAQLIYEGYITAKYYYATTYAGLTNATAVTASATKVENVYTLTWTTSNHAIAANSDSKLYVKVVFGWGETKFGGQNPYKYFNDTKANATSSEKSEAAETLQDMYTLVNGLKYQLNFNGTVEYTPAS